MRFYKKALEYYSKSISLDSSNENFDAFFNRSRLNFHIYSILKDINVVDITVDIGLGLDEVLKDHEDIIQHFNNDDRIINWDFYYNYGLILTEMIENNEEINEFLVIKGIENYNKLLDILSNELESFLNRLNGEINEDVEDDKELTEFTMIEQITPKVLFDLLINVLEFYKTIIELTENGIQIEYYKNLLNFLIHRVFSISEVLIQKFNPNNEDINGLNLSTDEIDEFRLIKHSIEGLFINEFNELVKHWELLPDTSSKLLAESDNFENFREHNINESDNEKQWDIIGYINKILNKSQSLITKEVQAEINLKSPLISSKITKSIEVLINRADNELKRYQLDYIKSVENRDLLKQNIISLLKNGLNLSKTNCGLREKVLDRFKREKLARECVIRLVIMTNDDFTEEDVIRNLGKYHNQEIRDLRQVEVYKSRLI